MDILFFLLAVGLPLISATILWRGKLNNGWIKLSIALFALTSTLHGSFAAPWYNYSYWVLGFVIIFVFGAVIKTGLTLPKADWSRPHFKGLAISTLLVLAALFGGHSALSSFSALAAPDQVTDLKFPLRDGTYAISQGGSGPPLQMGHARAPAQAYALDVVKINPLGYSGGRWLGNNSKTASILGDTVYSPCSGKVEFVRDGLPNMPVIKGDMPAGNLVVISCKEIIIAFAHLEPNSIPAEIGDQVSEYQPIGKVGMSGRTFGPHLHFHAEKGEWDGDFSKNPPAAITFDGKFLWKNRLVFKGD